MIRNNTLSTGLTTFFAATIVLLLSSMEPVAAQTKAASTAWLRTALKEKQRIEAISTNGLPFISEVYYKETPAGHVSLDLTGLKEITLVAWGTPDGNDYDWAVWADAKLTKTDGTVVYLSDLRPRFRRVEGNYFRTDVNLNNMPLSIVDKTYKKGVLAHANSTLIYDLGGEYVRFESDLGVDHGTNDVASLAFKVMVSSGEEEAKKLTAAVPELERNLGPMIEGSIGEWLTSPGTIMEKAALQRSIKNLRVQEYYLSCVDRLEAMPDRQKRILAYIDLAAEVKTVIDLQSQLEWLNTAAVGRALSDMQGMKGFDGNVYQAKYNELKELEKSTNKFQKIYDGDKAVVASAKLALGLKREILTANPELDMDRILVTKYNLGGFSRQAMAPGMGTQPNNWSNQYSARRTGFDAQIIELTGLRGEDGAKIKERVIYKPTDDAAVTDVHLHFDADKMLFTSTDAQDKRWHVFEINTDGTGLKNLTKSVPEPDVEFTDGCYLPDGRLIINTTLGYHGVPCVNGADAVGALTLFDPQTGYLRRLTFDQDNNWNPTVMNNGRVMYTRWEYTDLIHYFSRFVMHMNPDGTENKNLYGSGSYFPNSTFDMQPLPGGSSAFVGIISGHHGVARSGRLILFDPAKGRKEETGMVQEMPFSMRPIEPIIKDEMVDGVWPQFIKPHPLNDKYFLVTAKLNRGSLWGIYLVDVYDNLTLIKELEGYGFINPIPLRKRATPPVIPDRINEDARQATVFIQDLYEGQGLPGVPRGTVKKLRLLAYEYAYRDSPSDHSAQGIQAGWDIKRLLGEVPVEADGSAIFTIPSNTPVSIQPLDSMGRAIQWMRSWFVGMPGETVSCVGCHEDQNQIPIPKRVIASQRKPHPITVPEGGVRPYTFELEIQPILDRACVACHNNEEAAGGRNYTGERIDSLYGFGKSYLDFHPYFYRQGPEADMYVLTPYEFYATNSEMVQMLKNGHHGVELTDGEWQKIYNWVDFNVPYRSTFRARELKMGEHGYNQIERRKELANKYANGSAVDWQQEIRDYAAYLAAQTKATPLTKAELQAKVAASTKKAKEISVKGWPFTAQDAVARQGGKERRSVEIAPGVVMNFVWIPAGEFVMGSRSAKEISSPQAKVRVDKGFWMAEMEVNNAQYRACVPEHDNRLIGQFWKDHTGPNYEVNEDWRPSIRVSWEEAMAYCDMLSERTGLKVTLPTEAQWEWAARAGSAGDFWWGDTHTDFSTYENLADWNLRLMAVTGVNPQPMNPRDRRFPYWNYIPKDENVNDGAMLLNKPGSYKASPWGLYDMHGNVSEWTRSDFRPYPYSAKVDLRGNGHDTEKVVRGGSWYDRTKFATASARRHFLPWQRVWNVGFRVIIEE